MRSRSLFLIIAAAGLALLAGSVRAAPPFVSMSNPGYDAIVNIGDNVYLRANASDPNDPGGQVTQVDFYTNRVLLGSAMAPPFAVWWTNAVGTIEIQAVATDNSLERATSMVVRITAEPPRPRDLTWYNSTPGSSNAQWNTRDFRWNDFQSGGRMQLFHPGDAVSIYSWDPIFIGVDGVPVPVAPRSTGASVLMTVHGGDILTGSLTAGNGGVVLTNYAGSMSFPGGTVIRQSGGGLTYNIARAPPGASVHLGTGPITIIESRFQFDLMTNQFATLENDFYLESISTQLYQSSLRPAPYNSANATVRFTGTLNLNGRLNLDMGNGQGAFNMEGRRDTDYHEWAGPIIISQVRNVPTGFFVQGQNRSKGLLLSGNIKDGGGTGTNRLTFQIIGAPVIRLTGSNTYARGTFIDLAGGSPPGWIEVAPESSLGLGDVEVRGVLRLMGNQNVNSNATVRVGPGRIILDTGVKVRVSRMIMGGLTYTAGVFSRTNTFGMITSNGTIRVPAVNLQPTVVIISPANGTGVGAVDPLNISAFPTDQDSYIQRVEFYVDGVLSGMRTNPPFNLSLATPGMGQHTLQAVVYDDDGGTGTSPAVNITVAPGIDSIRHVETNVVVIEFRLPPGLTLDLEASDSLSAPTWSTIGHFAGAASIIGLTMTNSIPAGVSTRYYRLRSQ